MGCKALISVLLSTVCLCGCNALQDVNQSMLHRVAAADLEPLSDAGKGITGTPTNTQLVGALVVDSETKCARFANGLVLNENVVNTGLDITTTVATALGTLFTPLATVHAFTAAGSITSGSKTAIDSDIYAKMTIANFAQAIQVTYYADMAKYVDNVSGMSSADQAKLMPEFEWVKIQHIHRECALAPAEYSISAALTPSQAQTSQLTVAYTVKAGDSTTGIATALLNSINTTAAFQKAGVTATQQSPNSPNNVIILNAPPTTPIEWSTNVSTGGSEKLGVNTTGGVTTLTVDGTSGANDVLTVTGALQPAQTVVPGHKP